MPTATEAEIEAAADNLYAYLEHAYRCFLERERSDTPDSWNQDAGGRFNGTASSQPSI